MVRPSIGRLGRRPAMLIVGAATRDVVADDPRGWRLGGGVSYGAMAAARLGAQVRALIGADAQAATAAEVELLREAGAEVRLVPLRHGPVMENRDTLTGRRQLVEQASDPLPVEALPAEWRNSPAVLLAPVAGELDAAWASAFPASVAVALAWQGLLRRLEPGQPVARLPLVPSPLVTRADVALVSADDAAPGSAPLAQLISRDGQQLVISHGVRGALHVARSGAGLRTRYLPPLPPRETFDSTGAGDVFLAAWFAALLAAGAARRPGDRAGPLAVAAAAASLSVLGSGIATLPGLGGVCRELASRGASVRRPNT